MPSIVLTAALSYGVYTNAGHKYDTRIVSAQNVVNLIPSILGMILIISPIESRNNLIFFEAFFL